MPQQAGTVVQLPQQLSGGQVRRQQAQAVQFLQKVHASRVAGLRPVLDALVEIPLRAVGAEQRQLVAGKAVDRRAEDGDEGHILPRVVDDLQKGQGDAHLGGVEKVLLPRQLPGHLGFVQRLGQVEQHLVGRAVQDGDVLRPDVAQAPPRG